MKGDGYGRKSINGQRIPAHRWVWEQANGQVPEGWMVLHHCGVKSCVALDHLYLGNHSDNAKDSYNRHNVDGNQERRAEARRQLFAGVPVEEVYRTSGYSMSRLHQMKRGRGL